MSELELIVQKLQDRQLKKISNKTGINTLTLTFIRNGKTGNPKYKTIEKLKKYFEENP